MSLFYSITVSHKGLNRFRVIRGESRWEVDQKADALIKVWNDTYARQQQAAAKRKERDQRVFAVEQALDEARDRTEEAQKALSACHSILKDGVAKCPAFSWEEKKNHVPFGQAEPSVVYLAYRKEPLATDPEFVPEIGLLDKVVSSLKDKKLAAAHSEYEQALATWQAECQHLQAENEHRFADYEVRYRTWSEKKTAYEQNQAAHNVSIDLKRERHATGNPPEVLEYARTILYRSHYPSFFEPSFDIEYHGVRKILAIECELPNFEDFPKLKEVKYSKTKAEFSESFLAATEAKRLYVGFLCQVALRVVHEVFSSDGPKVVAGAVFNGYVSSINPATGQGDQATLVSLALSAKDLEGIALTKVDPESCLEGLGGRLSPKPYESRSVTPFTPDDLLGNPAMTPPVWAEGLRQQIESQGQACAYRFTDLQQYVGMVPGSRAKLGDSKALINLLNEAGLAVAPDAGTFAQAYRPNDVLALFLPTDPKALQPSDAYRGAIFILAMCSLVIVADGKLDAGEMAATRKYIEEAFRFSEADRQRGDALMIATLADSDYVFRALPKITKRLSLEQKEWAAEVATFVAVKEGGLSGDERRVLDRIFQTLSLPPEIRQAVIHKFTGGPIEVVVAQADPQEGGESIPAADQAVRPVFTLDLSRIAAISKETKEVVDLLSGVMMDREAKDDTPSSAKPEAPDSGVSELDPVYRGILNELLEKPEWSQDEFAALVARHGAMPIAAIDVLNAWADESLGDFLIEGDNLLTIRCELVRELVPA